MKEPTMHWSFRVPATEIDFSRIERELDEAGATAAVVSWHDVHGMKHSLAAVRHGSLDATLMRGGSWVYNATPTVAGDGFRGCCFSRDGGWNWSSDSSMIEAVRGLPELRRRAQGIRVTVESV
jgi:hypothetical protein